jgi:ligand-binding SRPBCC domain-containing protein
MKRIEVETTFEVPIEKLFDAERNITLHTSTQKHHSERAISGVTEGLIELGQEVAWEAIHFGISQRLRVRITHMERPHYFRDEMIYGIFKSFSHEHHFSEIVENKTIKKDVLLLSAPLGLLGVIAENVFLGCYMKRFLQKKNLELKIILES